MLLKFPSAKFLPSESGRVCKALPFCFSRIRVLPHCKFNPVWKGKWEADCRLILDTSLGPILIPCLAGISPQSPKVRGTSRTSMQYGAGRWRGGKPLATSKRTFCFYYIHATTLQTELLSYILFYFSNKQRNSGFNSHAEQKKAFPSRDMERWGMTLSTKHVSLPITKCCLRLLTSGSLSLSSPTSNSSLNPRFIKYTGKNHLHVPIAQERAS